MLLQIENLNVHYGVIHAVQGVSLSVGDREIVALLGANGAGKSTILCTVSGLIRPTSGRIVFADRDITGEQPHRIVAQGIGHVPEGRRVFADLTVKENLILGSYTRRRRGETGALLENLLTRFPRLKDRLQQAAGTLSGGEQQMLALARGLMSQPRVLLLDEPSMGLAPAIIEEVFDMIAEINRQGTTVLLVEQNAEMALSIAHRGYVLERGRLALEGTAAELAANESVRKAYLGESEDKEE
ncbi:MAG: ABC transporter ATP-binding protein [Ignavibacteriales bacterium]